MVDVTDPWVGGVSVTDKTDTDLQATRTYGGKLSDPDGDLARLFETLRREAALDTVSEAADRALRVELAALLDARAVTFTRDDFDVAYTVPPACWVESQVFSEVPLVDADAVDVEDRSLSFTTAPVVYEMAQAAIDEGAARTLTALVRQGGERLLGRR